jgi:hypothetical protein
MTVLWKLTKVVENRLKSAVNVRLIYTTEYIIDKDYLSKN